MLFPLMISLCLLTINALVLCGLGVCAIIPNCSGSIICSSNSVCSQGVAFIIGQVNLRSGFKIYNVHSSFVLCMFLMGFSSVVLFNLSAFITGANFLLRVLID